MYVYGPVAFRRLGRSLGVNPIPPKTCSYSCVYCQLGRTTRLQTARDRFYPREDIFMEIMERARYSKPGFITFIGDGEPTLCRDIGWLISRAKKKLSVPAAVITNGSLLYQEDVRRDPKNADVVILKLDAGYETTFRTINRPHLCIEFDFMIQGMAKFRREYPGQIWVEVMLVKGINDNEKELYGIKRSVDMIKPDRVYVLTPDRPPAEAWIESVNQEDISNAQEIIESSITVAG
jgi:wyosine [tRNA(Phe)-imidazoG37] synthetase (radical SAM superfamily)